MEEKDNRNRAADQIKRLSASKAAPANYDSNASAKVTHKNEERTGVLPDCKNQGKKNSKHKGPHSYCVLFNKAGMPKRKYKLHSSENCLGKKSDQESTKEGLGESLGNRATVVKQYQKKE